MLTVDVGGDQITLYTQEDVAQMLGVTRRTVVDYIRKNRIKTVLLNRHRLIPAGELARYLTARADDHPAGHMTVNIDLSDWENMETLI